MFQLAVTIGILGAQVGVFWAVLPSPLASLLVHDSTLNPTSSQKHASPPLSPPPLNRQPLPLPTQPLQLINYGTQYLRPYGWRISLAAGAVPALMLTIGAIILPDTPNSLVLRGHKDEGRKVLQRVRGTGERVWGGTPGGAWGLAPFAWHTCVDLHPSNQNQPKSNPRSNPTQITSTSSLTTSARPSRSRPSSRASRRCAPSPGAATGRSCSSRC